MTSHTKAIVCASLFFPAAYLAASITGLYFKSTNPSNVDVTQGLAYLGHQVLAATVIAVVLIVATIAFAVAARKETGPRASRLPLSILGANLLIIIMLLLVNAQTNKVQNRYLTDHGRPTLDQFFEAAKQQKQ